MKSFKQHISEKTAADVKHQPRDGDGQWTDTPGGKSKSGKKKNSSGVPKNKKKLTISQAAKALKSKGITLQGSAGQPKPPDWKAKYNVKMPNGKVKVLSADEIKDLV